MTNTNRPALMTEHAIERTSALAQISGTTRVKIVGIDDESRIILVRPILETTLDGETLDQLGPVRAIDMADLA